MIGPRKAVQRKCWSEPERSGQEKGWPILEMPEARME